MPKINTQQLVQVLREASRFSGERRYDCALDLTHLKKEPVCAWSKEADSQALQQSLKDLDAA